MTFIYLLKSNFALISALIFFLSDTIKKQQFSLSFVSVHADREALQLSITFKMSERLRRRCVYTQEGELTRPALRLHEQQEKLKFDVCNKQDV